LSVLDEHLHGPWQASGAMATSSGRARRRRKDLPNWRVVRYADLCRARNKSAYRTSVPYAPRHARSSRCRKTLASSGETTPPYEQRWVMRSGRRFPLVGAVVAPGRCA